MMTGRENSIAISLSSELDKRFVHSIMRIKDESEDEEYFLEKQHRFLLCDPLRNFLAGIPNITNITHGIYGSIRVILFITRYVL